MKLIRWLIALALLYILLSAAAGYFVCESSLHPGKRKLSQESRQKAESVAAQYHADMKDVSTRASDGTILKGWYFKTPQNSHQTVIVVHGLSDNRSGMLGYVQLLIRNGYNVLTPDWRAHGESGGTLATYGLEEKNDLKMWIDWAEISTDSKNYFALGESYGAAILLQSLKNERRISAAIAECSFATFREAAYDRMGQQIGAGNVAGATILFPIVQAGFITASWKYSLDLDQANPLESLQHSETPVLLIHGELDKNIPARHSRLLYTNTKKNGRVDYWETPKTGHSSTLGKWPQEFESRVIGWFHKYRR